MGLARPFEDHPSIFLCLWLQVPLPILTVCSLMISQSLFCIYSKKYFLGSLLQAKQCVCLLS